MGHGVHPLNLGGADEASWKGTASYLERNFGERTKMFKGKFLKVCPVDGPWKPLPSLPTSLVRDPFPLGAWWAGGSVEDA